MFGSTVRRRNGAAFVAAAAATVVISASALGASWSAQHGLGLPENNGFQWNTNAAASGSTVHAALWKDTDIKEITSSDGGTSWGTAKSLATHTGTKSFDTRALATSGKLVVVAYASSDTSHHQQLIIRRSVDNGASFLAPIVLASYTDASNQMGYVGLGVSGTTVLVAWTDRRNGNIWVRRSTDSGKTFGSAIKLGTSSMFSGGGKDGHVYLEMVGAKAYAVWFAATDGQGAKGISMRRSTDGGKTWKAKQTVFAGLSGTRLSTAASGGTLLVMYQIRGGSNYGVQVSRSANSGSTFSNTIVAPPTSAFPSPQDIAILGSHAVLTYVTNSDTINSRISTNGGGAWAAADTVGGAHGIAVNTIVGPDKIAVLYTQDDGFTANSFAKTHP